MTSAVLAWCVTAICSWNYVKYELHFLGLCEEMAMLRL